MYEYPTSRFVADFLGDVNVLEARVVEAGARPWSGSTPPQAGCDIVADRGAPAVAGETVWVAIRPEKFALAKEPPPRRIAVNCMAGEVWDIGYLGDVSIYHVRLRERRRRPLHPGQPAAPDRAADHLGGPGLAELGRPTPA